MSLGNLTLLTDFYQLTMMQGYYKANKSSQLVVFDLFYRNNPENNGYVICAGLQQVIDYIRKLKFSKSDIDYLKSTGIFSDDFLSYLNTFKFTGDLYAIPEGTIVFPKEPLLKIVAPIIEAQLIESAILNIINHQSLIATKTSRIVHAAKDDDVMEFGLRRAQGPDAGIYGARAALIAGCSSTSNVMAAKMFHLPVKGTVSHSWIMSFDNELDAFRSYAAIYPDHCYLLVDTYDTLNSGVPNAIKVFSELKQKGHRLVHYGIRLDSGDLAWLSKQARILLDQAGFSDAVIIASSDLDEHLITSLKSQDAKITSWGVGTNLITSKDAPSLGGVYKLSAVYDKAKDTFIPKIKISDNPSKTITPGNKTVYRIYSKASGKIIADLICLIEEKYSESNSLLLFDSEETWKKMHLAPNSYSLRELLLPVFKNGKCVFKSPSVMQIRDYCKHELTTLWEEARRIDYPYQTHVDLSEGLWKLRKNLIEQ